jgi:hypothetical protein
MAGEVLSWAFYNPSNIFPTQKQYASAMATRDASVGLQAPRS